MNDKFLIIAEIVDNKITENTAQLVSAALALKADSKTSLGIVILAPTNSDQLDYAKFLGVDEIFHIQTKNTFFDPDFYCRAVIKIMTDQNPRIVLFSHTANSTSYAPMVAVKLRTGFASDLISVSLIGSSLTAKRSYYGGKVEADLAFDSNSPTLLLLRPGSWKPAQVGGTAEVYSVTIEVDEESPKVIHLEFVEPEVDDVDITRANIILSIGRGVGDRENVARFELLADRLGVTLAASRPIIDAGWLPKSRQVGQSGISVKPKLYIALGISGATQHIYGMKSSETILAVNTDSNAPIFNVAHLGAVANIFEVLDELEKLI